jgi:hypothetical protein
MQEKLSAASSIPISLLGLGLLVFSGGVGMLGHILGPVAESIACSLVTGALYVSEWTLSSVLL